MCLSVELVNLVYLLFRYLLFRYIRRFGLFGKFLFAGFELNVKKASTITTIAPEHSGLPTITTNTTNPHKYYLNFFLAIN